MRITLMFLFACSSDSVLDGHWANSRYDVVFSNGGVEYDDGDAHLSGTFLRDGDTLVVEGADQTGMNVKSEITFAVVENRLLLNAFLPVTNIGSGVVGTWENRASFDGQTTVTRLQFGSDGSCVQGELDCTYVLSGEELTVTFDGNDVAYRKLGDAFAPPSSVLLRIN